jgi:hypothetical protein
VRRIGTHFDFEVSALGPSQLADYFTQMKAQHSWSGVKLDLYGLKFFTLHVLGRRPASSARPRPAACPTSSALSKPRPSSITPGA